MKILRNFLEAIVSPEFPVHESGHVPVGQLEAADEEESFMLTPKVEKIFSVFLEWHFSHARGFRVPGFSKNAVTWPHFLH